MIRKSIVLSAVCVAMMASPGQNGGENPKSTTEKAQSGHSETIKSKEIEITGVKSLDSDEIYRVLGVKTKSWFEFWRSDQKRIAEALIPSIEDTLRGYLDSRGYYDATFKISDTPQKITIKIDENRPVTISSISIESDFPLENLITFKKGEPFDTDRFTSVKESIKKELLDRGYCSYDLDSKAYVDLEKHSVDLKYRLHKGDLCHFGKTTVVKKPDDIPEEVILSRMAYEEGDVFSTEKINDSYTNLNKLGAFGQTLIDTDKKFFNVIPPEVSATPRNKLHRYMIAGGYDSEVGARLKATYDHYNFFGGARKLELYSEISSELMKVEGRFFQPVLFEYNDYFFDFYAKAGYYQEIYSTYDDKSSYFDMKLSHFGKNYTLDLGLALENTEIKKTATDDSIIGGTFLMLYPYLNVIYDKRDSKLNPKNGYYLSGYFEYGLPFDDEASDYLKWILEGRLIHTFDKLTLAGVGKIGVIDDSKGVLPASKYFYAGGSFSNRAYGDRDIGITVSPTEYEGLGGRSWLNFSAEADYPIWGELYGAVFYDATTINEESWKFDAPWIQSAGVGVRYATPIGPIKVDFAGNVHDFSANRVSMMIGQSF